MREPSVSLWAWGLWAVLLAWNLLWGVLDVTDIASRPDLFVYGGFLFIAVSVGIVIQSRRAVRFVHGQRKNAERERDTALARQRDLEHERDEWATERNVLLASQSAADSRQTQQDKIALLIERTQAQKETKVEPNSGPEGQRRYYEQRDQFWEWAANVFDPTAERLMHQKLKTMVDAARDIERRNRMGCGGDNIVACAHFLQALNSI